MIIKTYTRDFLFIGLCNANDVQIKEQPNKEDSYSFSITDNSIMTNAYFCELIDQETNELKKMPNKVGVITSIDKDYKISVASMERYLEKISNIPENWNWNLKNLSNVIKDHCYGFRQITYSSLSEIQSFVSSYHIQTAVVESGNGEVFADSAPFFSSENERYYYSDGYVIYRIQVPTNARRQGMVLRWKDTVGTTTDIGVQFAWSDSTTIPTTWSNEQSPVRGDSYTPNETDGIDIPESLLSYLYVKFNLKYDTGTISASYPKGVNYENEITTVTEPENNIVYYGKTAILYGFEVIYRVDTLISYGEIDVPNTKILDADITGKGNLLESLKALCEAYGYTFTITKTGNNFYLNVYQDYGTDLTNETFVSAKVNSLITRQDYKKELLEAVDAYGSGDGIDRIHAFVKIVDNPMNIGTFEDNDESDINTLVTKATNYINKENDELIAISFEFYERQFNISDKIRILCNDVVFTGKITEVSLNLKNSGWTKTYTVGIKSSALRTLFDPMFDGNYIPTVLAPRNVTANRVADGWVITWSSNYTNFILEYRKDENSFWQRKFINGNSVTIPYTEYLKIYEFRVYAIKDNIISSASNTIIFDSGKDTSVDSLIDGTADVDSPDKPIITKCIADKDGITINLQALADGLKNSIGKVIIEIKKSDTWATIISSNSLNNYYFFDRNSDGYPESSTINTWQVRCKIINSYQKESAYSSTSTVNTSNYGTWLMTVPSVFGIANGRTIDLIFYRENDFYGTSEFRVQIQKTTDGANWYSLGSSENAYTDENGYKGASGFTRSIYESFRQVVPLKDQTQNLPKDTEYRYRVALYNLITKVVTTYSAPVLVVAKGTGVKDVVEGAIKEAQLASGAVTNIKIADATLEMGKLANGIRPTRTVAALPVSPFTGYAIGDTVVLTSDNNKLYRFTGTAFIKTVDGVDLIDGSINNVAKFAAGLKPPRVVSALPVSPFTGYANGDLVVLTTDSKLYRFDGSKFTKHIDAVDIVANSITAGQIATGAINADELAANAVEASKIKAGAVTTEKMTANSIEGDRIKANSLDAGKIVANSITAGQIQAGAIGATEIAAEAVQTKHMKADTIDGGVIAADSLDAKKIKARSITTENLSVTARSKVNTFSDANDGLTGWWANGYARFSNADGFGITKKGSYQLMISDIFTVEPNEILEVSFGIQIVNQGGGMYVGAGVQFQQSFRERSYDFINEKWGNEIQSTNVYFVDMVQDLETQWVTTYILGNKVDIKDVPAPKRNGTREIKCLQLTGTDTSTYLRTGQNVLADDFEWRLYCPLVVSVGSSKIVAENIVTKMLSSISANIGAINSGSLQSIKKTGKQVSNVSLDLDNESFWIGNDVFATNPSTAENNEEAQFIKYDPADGGNFWFKLANFIVTAVSSVIHGTFQVKSKTTGKPVLFEVDDSTKNVTVARDLIVNGLINGNKKETTTNAASIYHVATCGYVSSLMLLTRSGETILVSSGNTDSDVEVQAIRLLERYTKIINIWYLPVKNGLIEIYVTTDMYANFLTVKNISGATSLKLTKVTTLPEGVIQVPIRKPINNGENGVINSLTVAGQVLAVQPFISQAILTGSNNRITCPNLAESLYLEIGDVIRIQTPTYTTTGNFVALNQTARNWHGICQVNNDVYACVYGGDIYKQTNAKGNFVALGQESRDWQGICQVNNDVYACVYGGDIYKQTNATGNFVALGQPSRNWRGICQVNNDVYACVSAGDIYKQTNATGNFVALGQPSRNWRGICQVNNDVYACVLTTDIYKQTNATGNFVALGQTSRNWQGICQVNNDVYACVSAGDIYKQTNAKGNFVALGQESRNWRGICQVNNDVYACVLGTDIYKQTAQSGTYDKLHTVESISGNDIVVNYEHCGNRGNGSLKLITGAGSTTFTRIAKWYNAPIGLGQAWVSLVSIRQAGVTYTNSTNRTITLGTRFGPGTLQTIKVNGLKVGESHTNGYSPVSVNIPHASTFVITEVNSFWVELR